MVTAAARTNAIGHTVSGIDSSMGDMSKTDQFKIHSADGKSDAFKDLSYFHRTRKCVLGDVLSHKNDDLQIIGQSIFENGVGLREKVEIYLFQEDKNKKNIWEVRTKTRRYMCLQNRVYSTDLEHD